MAVLQVNFNCKGDYAMELTYDDVIKWFDDYFKAEAIEWAWQLLTKLWKIEPDRLWATVFAGSKDDGLPKDEQAQKLWTKVTPISADRVLAFGKEDNFWEMGQTGPCGPCSEIHIDLGPDRCDMKNVKGHTCGVNAGCARFIELWNLSLFNIIAPKTANFLL